MECIRKYGLFVPMDIVIPHTSIAEHAVGKQVAPIVQKNIVLRLQNKLFFIILDKFFQMLSIQVRILLMYLLWIL